MSIAKRNAEEMVWKKKSNDNDKLRADKTEETVEEWLVRCKEIHLATKLPWQGQKFIQNNGILVKTTRTMR